MVCCTERAMPISYMPKSKIIISGNTTANSTSAWPRFRTSDCNICGRAKLERIDNVLERSLNRSSKQCNYRDHNYGYQSKYKCILGHCLCFFLCEREIYLAKLQFHME